MLIKTPKYNHWQTDQSNAAKYITQLTASFGIKCNVVSIEHSSEETLAWLDNFSGIDWIAKTAENQVYGVAVRVQWMQGRTPWNTFTIRYERHTGTKTEYQKRIEAISGGYFHPKLTLQAYFQSGTEKLLSAAIVDTQCLYALCESQPELVHENMSDNIFKYVHWYDLKKHGCRIMII